MKISCAYFSHPGYVRTVNQDGLFINGEIIKEGNFAVPMIVQRELHDATGLFVVVDGAGGYNAGEIACQTILDELRRSVERLGQLPLVEERHLTSELIRVQDAMSSTADRDSRLHEMAATIAGIYFMSGRTGEDPPCGMGIESAGRFLSRKTALAFNCGDCRVYRVKIKKGVELPKLTHDYSVGLLKLTHDHSYVQQLCDDRKIAEDDMRTHPRKNLVTEALQAGKIEVKVNSYRYDLGTDDRFLICCGGVWKALPEEVIEKHSSLPALEDAALNLSDALMKTDYRDNVSFVMIET